jgi:hypothetical protein
LARIATPFAAQRNFNDRGDPCGDSRHADLRIFRGILPTTPEGEKWCPEEESIVKPMILKGKIFLSGRQNDGPFNGPRQHLLEWFECWKAQQRSLNLIAHQLLLRNPDAI